MNQLLAIPLEVRLLAIFVLGACLGGLANLATYRLAWHPRPISPWSRPASQAPPRRFGDRFPIVGWFGLRREAAIHGTGFWIRPMLVELLLGWGLAAFYWWEIGCGGLLPMEGPPPLALGLQTVLHGQFAAHALLVWLMVVASMIDLDEKIIPDAITVPGTLLGLLLATAVPWSLLPHLLVPVDRTIPPEFWQSVSPDRWPFLRLTSPNEWPVWLGGAPHCRSLAVGLGCWWLWCVALMPRTWYPRHGWRRAWRLSIARLVREPVTYAILAMGLVGSLVITAVWFWGELRWVGLLSALVGMAAAGGLVWMVRIIGSAALRREAMGFGDVTLMAMIGTFLGWQACPVVFFLAPFAALVVGVSQWVLRRDNEIPYGPYLCLAAVVLIARWPAIWDWLAPFFIGWLVPAMVLCCLALLGLMLALWQRIREACG
ncbi:MAG: prepilin peptidase [Pirellulales bacterium]|nr:prepilin peptidase [Pirellulales bacterium]